MVSAGEDLGVRMHLQHNRAETVTVPFVLWVEDEDGSVITKRTSAPLTLRQGDARSHELTIPIPPGVPPGRYLMKLGIERMQQGLVGAVQPFQVVE